MWEAVSYTHNLFMHFHAPVHFPVRSLQWARVPGVPLWLPQAWPACPGASCPVPEQLTLPLAGLVIKQQFCLLGNDAFCLQPPRAACSHTCPIVSEWSVISKLLSPLPGPCRSQRSGGSAGLVFLQERFFHRCLLLFHGPVLLCLSSGVQGFLLLQFSNN